MPSVSVIIPTYNRAESVARALESVLLQTHAPDEIVVVDDGSTDNTGKVLSAYKDDIRYVYQENSGVSAARNHGVRESTSEWVAFLDSDDAWVPMKLERQFVAAQRWGEAVLYTTDILWGDFPNLQDYGSLKADFIERPLVRVTREHLNLNTWLLRRNTFLELGGFDESMRVAEDSHLLFRLALHGPLVHLAEPLTVCDAFAGGDRLTSWSPSYQREIVVSTARLLEDTYSDSRLTDLERRSVRKPLAYYYRRLGEIAVVDGENEKAIAFAKRVISLHGSYRDIVGALGIITGLGIRPVAWSTKYGRSKNWT